MSHNENINFLYHKYKTCIRNKFQNQLKKSNEYINPQQQCKKEKESIQLYQLTEFEKIGLIKVEEQQALFENVEMAYLAFNPHGWSEKQVRN
jgi:hypothetical protein